MGIQGRHWGAGLERLSSTDAGSPGAVSVGDVPRRAVACGRRVQILSSLLLKSGDRNRQRGREESENEVVRR